MEKMRNFFQTNFSSFFLTTRFGGVDCVKKIKRQANRFLKSFNIPNPLSDPILKRFEKCAQNLRICRQKKLDRSFCRAFLYRLLQIWFA